MEKTETFFELDEKLAQEIVRIRYTNKTRFEKIEENVQCSNSHQTNTKG